VVVSAGNLRMIMTLVARILNIRIKSFNNCYSFQIIMMGSIIEIETLDHLPLYGLYHRVTKSKTILINIHGTASNFYENYFLTNLSIYFFSVA